MLAGFQAIQCEYTRDLQDTLEMRKRFSEQCPAGSSCYDEEIHVHISFESKNVNDRLNDFSLFQNPSFLENQKLALTSVLGKDYDLFGFGLLHNLHLRIFRLLKYYTFKCLCSGRAMTKPGGVV